MSPLNQLEERLFTPGPTPLPESVREILARPIIHHRTGEFQTVLARATAGLMRVFHTRQPALTLTTSGTGGMEAAIVNLASSKDTVVVLNGGKFGERWSKVCRAYGLRVAEYTKRWGEAFGAEDTAEFLDREGGDAGLVVMTHSETSTGVLNDLEGVSRTVRERGKLLIADVVTSLGVHPVEFDAWGLGAAVTGSQKGLMLPPGLAAVVVSEAGWERAKRSDLPKFYFDLVAARDSLNKNSTPFTPAVPLVLALEESLRLIEAEGLEAVHARHARHAAACRAAVAAFGLELFAESPANGLTAVRAPEDRDGQEIVRVLRENHGVRIAGGQAPMKGKLFRLGHMGHYTDDDIRHLIARLETALEELGWAKSTGAVGAAESALTAPVSG